MSDIVFKLLREIRNIDGQDWKLMRVEAFIDDVKLDGSYLDIEAIFLHSKVSHSQFFPLTCTCLEPGCSGYFNPVLKTTYYAANTIQWHFPSYDPIYGGFSGKTFTFNVDEYNLALDNIYREIKLAEDDGFVLEHFLINYYYDLSTGLEFDAKADLDKHSEVPQNLKNNSRAYLVLSSMVNSPRELIDGIIQIGNKKFILIDFIESLYWGAANETVFEDINIPEFVSTCNYVFLCLNEKTLLHPKEYFNESRRDRINKSLCTLLKCALLDENDVNSPLTFDLYKSGEVIQNG